MEEIAAWLERHHVSLATGFTTVALLIAASIVILLLNRLVRHRLEAVQSRLHLPYATVLTITRAITGALWVITAMLVLDLWGVGLGGLWSLLVSAAAVIGVGFLATWAMVSNFTASFFIALWRPFRLGDTVELLPENLKGRVIDRNLMFTVLREESGSVIQIPNNLFFQKMFRVGGRSEQSLFESLEAKGSAPPGTTGPPP
jgi:small-conductance mechanosensitive channel